MSGVKKSLFGSSDKLVRPETTAEQKQLNKGLTGYGQSQLDIANNLTGTAGNMANNTDYSGMFQRGLDALNNYATNTGQLNNTSQGQLSSALGQQQGLEGALNSSGGRNQIISDALTAQQNAANMQLPSEYWDTKVNQVGDALNKTLGSSVANLGSRGVVNSSLFGENEQSAKAAAADALNRNLDQGIQLYSQMAMQPLNVMNQQSQLANSNVNNALQGAYYGNSQQANAETSPYNYAVSGLGSFNQLGQSFANPANTQLDRMNAQQNAGTYVKQGSSGLLGGALGAVTGGLGSALGNNLANQWYGNQQSSTPTSNYAFPSWEQFNSMPKSYIPTSLGVQYGGFGNNG